MNLMAREALLPILACPRCRSPLKAADDVLSCTRPECGRRFPAASGQPVLVDFETSILSEGDVRASSGGSVIERGRKSVAGRLIQALLPTNKVGAVNADRLKSLLLAALPRPTILIIGGGSAGEGTETLYEDGSLQLIAFDIYGSALTQFIADAHQIPLADESVDAVWIQAVLEHVLDPWRVAAEIHRVLKPEGLVYAETPFLQQVHEGAYDFTRFTESGHRWLFRHFEAIDSGVVLGPASQLLWSIEHVVRGTFRSVKAGIAAKLALFWLRFFDRIIPAGYASDAASAVYFLGRKSAAKIGPRDIVAFYQGAHARRG